MSFSELNKTDHPHNESANNIPITQENSRHAFGMELVKKSTETPASKEFVCIDIIEDSIKHRSDTNEEVKAGALTNNTDLKVHVKSPEATIRKNKIKEFYDSMVDFGKQKRLTRQIRRQKRSPQLPVTNDHDLTKCLTKNPLQAQGYLPGPESLHSQGNPQKEDQGNLIRLRGGLDFDSGERSSFVILVLAITCIMLGFTAMFIGSVVLIPDLRKLFQDVGVLVIIPATITLVSVNCVFAYSECGRRLPCSVVLLTFTVLAMSFLAATVSSMYKTDIIFQAFLATFIIVGICTALACLSFDFTSYLIYVIGISLAVALVTVMFFGLRLVTGKKMTILNLILTFVCTIVQVMVLVVELQMILGGKTVEMAEDDYALGAFYLYTSVVNIFLNMISLIGTMSDDF